MSRNSAWASSADSSSSGRPNVRDHATWRMTSCSRSSVQARRMPPHSTQPQSSVRYSATESIIIRVSDTLPRSCPTSPAE